MKESKLLTAALGGIILLAAIWVVSPALAATPLAPYVTNTNKMGDGTYAITGTAEPGSTIRITGGNSTIIATTTVGGIWSATVDIDEGDDLSNLSFTSINSMGERSNITRLNENGTVAINVSESDDNENDEDDDNVVVALVLPGIVFSGSFGI